MTVLIVNVLGFKNEAKERGAKHKRLINWKMSETQTH